MINGTAGQLWPPFLTTESTLPFYSPDACRWVSQVSFHFPSVLSLSILCKCTNVQIFFVFFRSLELVYQRQGKFKDIPLYRFVAPKTMFANGTDYPPNEGFCPCRQSGLLNVSRCRHSEYICISVYILVLYFISVLGVNKINKFYVT